MLLRKSLIGSVLLLSVSLVGCSNEETTGETEISAPAIVEKKPSLMVQAKSKTQICETFEAGKRRQYQVEFSDTLHFGVSFGQHIDSLAPVLMHITRSEVRAFQVANDGEYCFHFDNRQPHDVSVEFTHRPL